MMGEYKDLENKKAISKIKEIADAANSCMFTTNLTKIPLQARPMATQKVDEEGNIWFFSDKDSDKNEDITKDSRVQLFYANPGKYEFISIYGQAQVLYDRDIIETLWTNFAKAWFKGGKDDPQLSLIKVIPEEAYYWDTQYNKMVSFFKIAVATISSSEVDDGGVEGKLKVK